MMYMCKQIKKENIVSMYDERVAELEHLLNVAENKLADEALRNERLENTNKHVRAKSFDETSMMGGIIRYLFDECGLEQHHLEQAITASSWVDSEVIDVLEYHECVPEGWLSREYYVTVTVPVSVCMTIVAKNPNDAEEIARDLLEGNGLESYDMEYNSYYDGEYTVEEA
jgi:antitoxin component HigA of HigAB toxin-antitoxin module